MLEMTIDEMKQHQWSVSWSGGKDSTATIILMHEHKIPIKEIIYVRMMWDENTPATLPIMTEFVDHATSVFRSWGYKVSIIPSIKTAKSLAQRVYKRSLNPSKNGKKYGISAFCRGSCSFNGIKVATIKSIKQSEFEMIGYASDETERINRLTGSKCSILVALGITENQAMQICNDYHLLSPLYLEGKTVRDGCWFCPNCKKMEREKLRKEFPELYKNIVEMIQVVYSWNDPNLVYQLGTRNHWIEDYETERSEKLQCSFFDFSDELNKVE